MEIYELLAIIVVDILLMLSGIVFGILLKINTDKLKANIKKEKEKDKFNTLPNLYPSNINYNTVDMTEIRSITDDAEYIETIITHKKDLKEGE